MLPRSPPLVLVALCLGSAPAAQLVEQALLLASDPSDFDSLGRSVAVDGQTIVLGRPDDDTGAISRHGSVSVYVEPRGGWSGTLTESARLFPPTPATNGVFGATVAVEGDTIVVGEPGYSATLALQGALHVYRRPAGGWSGGLAPVATLLADETHTGASLGFSLAMDGGTIVAGAPFDDGGRGTAFVFVEPPGGWHGTRTPSAKIRLTSSMAEGFGTSVGVSGSWLVVGAPASLTPAFPQGSAYVLREPSGGWQGAIVPGASTLLQAAKGGPGDRFGVSVAIDGDRLVVGAPGAGQAYVFERGAAWTQRSRLAPSGSQGSFGQSVAIDGSLVVVGSPDPGIGGAGAAHAFREPAGGWLGPGGPSAELVTSVPPAATSNFLGQSVAIDGTLVLSGAPSLSAEGTVGGAGLVHLLQPAGAAFRNAGTNPASLVASPATLGGTLDATVDLATTGHSSAILFAFDTPATVLLGGGQTLLALDGGSGELLTGSGLQGSGPLATFTLPIPGTPAAYSLDLSVQALHAFGTTPFALSNAYDVTIGF